MEVDRSRSNDNEDDWGEEDFFSDESSFYGDEDMKKSYEQRAASYDSTEFWKSHLKSVQYIAAQNRPMISSVRLGVSEIPVKKEDRSQSVPNRPFKRNEGAQLEPSSKHPDSMDLDTNPPALVPLPAKPYNPFEGDEMGKQLSESLPDFLERLQPSTTTIESGPWIRIANPASKSRLTDPYLASFKDEGNGILEEFMRRRDALEEANPTKPPASITRMLSADRAWLETSIISLAKSKNVTCGKWMLFPSPRTVDDVWAKVAKGTLDGALGHAARVATDDGGDKPERLICIYTEDAWDKADVLRVLTEMKRLKLVGNGGEDKSIYYKCDAYTYLGITSRNQYKLRASLYGSRDLFKEMHADMAPFGRR